MAVFAGLASRFPCFPFVLIAVAVAAACGDSGTGLPDPDPDPPGVPTSVAVSPASVSFSALGDTAKLTATVSDQYGQVMAGVSPAWSSADRSVASVSASGVATAIGNGTAVLTATAGSAAGSASVTVEQVAVSVRIVAGQDSLMVGDSTQMVAEVADGNGAVLADARVDVDLEQSPGSHGGRRRMGAGSSCGGGGGLGGDAGGAGSGKSCGLAGA